MSLPHFEQFKVRGKHLYIISQEVLLWWHWRLQGTWLQTWDLTLELFLSSPLRSSCSILDTYLIKFSFYCQLNLCKALSLRPSFSNSL